MDFSDPKEVGRRIAAARGYRGGTIGSFAVKLGISEPTLRSYEDGKLGNYVARPRDLLERVREVAEVPAEIVGLIEPSEAAAATLRGLIDDLASQVTELDADLATVQVDLADARKRQGLAEHAEEGTAG